MSKTDPIVVAFVFALLIGCLWANRLAMADDKPALPNPPKPEAVEKPVGEK